MITLFENFNRNDILNKLSCKIKGKYYKNKIFDIIEIRYDINKLQLHHPGLPESADRKTSKYEGWNDIRVDVKFEDVIEIFPYKECECTSCIESTIGEEAKKYNL
jgi:hypothetical protein